MNLEIIILSERSQRKVHAVWFYLYKILENAKVIHDKKQIKFPRNGGNEGENKSERDITKLLEVIILIVVTVSYISNCTL